jgi:pimeloyl-ACP methyl ester carboxylesterase
MFVGDTSRIAASLELRQAGAGAPLVLIHGIQGTADAWSPVLPHLLRRRCVAPNLPGRGLSPRWTAAETRTHDAYYHIDHYADLVHALLHGLRSRHDGPVALAGWSMGVSVILSLLARHGQAGIDRIVLVSGTACAVPGAVWFRGESAREVAEEAHARARRLGLTAVADADAVAASWASVRAADLRTAAQAVTVPALVIHGEADDQCPLAHGLWLADHLRASRWMPLPGVGHAALSQATTTVGEAMRAFLEA